MRLRFMAMPRSSFRYASSRSKVQEAKGSPRSRGLVRLLAITSLTCSGVYVGARPGRGRSSRPATPCSLNRVSQQRTVCSWTPSSRAMAGTLRPSLANRIILARSTVRAAAVLERESCSMVWVSSADIGRTRNANGHLLPRMPE